jgi:hypothetical protein
MRTTLVTLSGLYFLAFITGEHDDAISHVDDLIDTVWFNSICYVIQARA